MKFQGVGANETVINTMSKKGVLGLCAQWCSQGGGAKASLCGCVQLVGCWACSSRTPPLPSTSRTCGC